MSRQQLVEALYSLGMVVSSPQIIKYFPVFKNKNENDSVLMYEDFLSGMEVGLTSRYLSTIILSDVGILL